MKSQLKIFRVQKDETLESMAGKLHIGISRYYYIENGKRPATPVLAEKIANILGVKEDEIFLPQSFTVRKLEATGTEGN
jgi:transcriptional regulator with XRE-family HTH domain